MLKIQPLEGMGLAWNICAPLGTLSTFFFNPVFQVSTAKNEINLFNNHILIVAPVTCASRCDDAFRGILVLNFVSKISQEVLYLEI